MYCVIQEIERKKPNLYGEHKELEAYSPYEIEGRAKWSYRHTGDKFERPIQTAYKITIRESHRVNGVVTLKQSVVTTVDYYSVAANWFCISDYDRKIEAIAQKFDTSAETVYSLIYAKLDPLTERIHAEYQKTEEYIVSTAHNAIIKEYLRKKEAFAKGYGLTDMDQYDYCYDVFGNVKNQAYIDQIIEIDRQRQQAYSSYSKQGRSNYTNSGSYDYSKLFSSADSTFTADEKAMLKSFYKTLSKRFHPDMNPNTDTTNEMQLLNKLKENWGI